MNDCWNNHLPSKRIGRIQLKEPLRNGWSWASRDVYLINMMIFIDAPPKTNILHLKMMVSKFGISSSRGSFSGSMLVFWGVSSKFFNIVIFESWEPKQPALSALPKLSHPSLLHKVPQPDKTKNPIELEFGTEIITLIRSYLKESGGCSLTKPSKRLHAFFGFKTLSPALQKQRRDEPAKKPPKNSEDLHSITGFPDLPVQDTRRCVSLSLLSKTLAICCIRSSSKKALGFGEP